MKCFVSVRRSLNSEREIYLEKSIQELSSEESASIINSVKSTDRISQFRIQNSIRVQTMGGNIFTDFRAIVRGYANGNRPPEIPEFFDTQH